MQHTFKLVTDFRFVYIQGKTRLAPTGDMLLSTYDFIQN